MEVIIATPSPLRAALIGCGHISARHIPAWQATPDAELVALCDRAGVRFMVMEMWRHIPAYKDMRRYLDAGLIGPVHAMRIVGRRRPMNRSHPVNPEQPYFAEMPKLYVYEMAIHWIDGARYLMGDVESVYARMAKVNPIIAGEDAALVVLGHAGGGTTLLDGNWANPEDSPRPAGDGGVLLEGRDGSLRYDALEGELRHITTDTVTVLERYPGPPQGIQAAFDNCIGDFAGALRWGREFVSSGTDNLETLAATLAAYDSVAKGTAVSPADVA